MSALLVVLAWVALSVLVTLAWVGYRTFVARHSLEEHDSMANQFAVSSPTSMPDLAPTPLLPGPRAPGR